MTWHGVHHWVFRTRACDVFPRNPFFAAVLVILGEFGFLLLRLVAGRGFRDCTTILVLRGGLCLLLVLVKPRSHWALSTALQF